MSFNLNTEYRPSNSEHDDRLQVLEKAYTDKIVQLERTIAQMQKKERENRSSSRRMIDANISMQQLKIDIIKKDDLMNKALVDIQSLEGQHEELSRTYDALKVDFQTLLKRLVISAKEKQEAVSQLSKAQEEKVALQKRCEELSESQAQLRQTVFRVENCFERHSEEIAHLKDECRKKTDENVYLQYENARLKRLLEEKFANDLPELVDIPEDCSKEKSSQLDRSDSALRASTDGFDERAVEEA